MLVGRRIASRRRRGAGSWQRSTAAALAGIGLAALSGSPAGALAAEGATPCDRFAAPDGSDSAAGHLRSPFATMQRLADALAAGEVGCLREGVYEEEVVEIARGGAEGRPLTLRSYPGERATLVGRLWITDRADHVTVLDMRLDGSGAPPCPEGGTCELQPSPVVNGDHATFAGNDVTNDNSAICFTLGSSEYGRAVGTLITASSIHHCGRLPRTNHDHGIYVSSADDTVIAGNLIYANADRGLQLYPDAQGTRVAFNVIDGNGTGIQFSGGDGVASNDSVVERNLITNSEIADVTSWYPGDPVGEGNVVRWNCLTDLDEPGEESGFSLAGNLVGDPLYVDAGEGDFRLHSDSPCLELTGDIGAAVTGREPVHRPAASRSTDPLSLLVGAVEWLLDRIASWSGSA